MAEVNSIPASPRVAAGKGSARQARRDGLVPAVIYGNKEDPIMLTMERRLVVQQLENPQFFIQLVDVEIDGTKHRVLPRDVQFHPVTDAPMHIDFLRYDPNRTVTAAVPVVFEGEEESHGLRAGGVLNIVRHEVEVLATAENIPPELLINLAGLEIGDSVHASSVTLPEGVEYVISDRDFTIVTIAAPTIIREEEEEAEGEEGEAAEGAAEGEGEAEAAEESGEGEED